MLSSPCRNAVTRQVALRRGRASLRNAGRRLNSTTSSTSGAGPSNANAQSHLAAGVAGGAVVLGGIYGWYHLSGTKKTLDTAKSFKDSVVNSAQSLKENTPSPNEAIKYLRGIAKSYSAIIPGSATYIDASFDGLEQLTQTHGDQVNDLVLATYNDVKSAVSKGQMDAPTAKKVLEIIQQRGQQFAELAERVGGDIMDRNPEVKEKIGQSWNDLKKFAKESGGDEAGPIIDKAKERLGKIFEKGFSAESLAEAKKLLDETREQVQALGTKAWDKAKEQVGPYLDKVPQLKEMLEKTDVKTALMSGGGAAAVWGKIKDIASKKGKVDEKQVEEIKKMIEEQMGKAKESSGEGAGKAWESLQAFLGAIPGGKDILEKTPDLEQLIKAASNRSEDAQKLMKETYGDIAKVLKEKAEKAKALGEDVKEDSDSSSSQGKESKDSNESKGEKKDDKKDDKGKKDDKKGDKGKKDDKKEDKGKGKKEEKEGKEDDKEKKGDQEGKNEKKSGKK